MLIMIHRCEVHNTTTVSAIEERSKGCGPRICWTGEKSRPGSRSDHGPSPSPPSGSGHLDRWTGITQ